MNITKNAIIIFLIIIAIVSRWVPHLPNFTPVAALALLAGAYLRPKIWAYIIPIVVMVVSDIILGFHISSLFVYFSMLIYVWAGQLFLHGAFRPLHTIGAALFCSITFFLISNFGVWCEGWLYPMDASGLINCYIQGIPFFRNTILGDLTYTIVLFGCYHIAINYLMPVGEKVKSKY